MTDDNELRNQLVHLLTVRQAHMDLEDAVAGFPEEEINTKPTNCEYTFWHLLEHMRITQKDILDYIESDDYKWLNWPDDYWPEGAAETDPGGWHHTIEAFHADRQRLAEIIGDPDVDLFAPLPNSGEEQHYILREINLVAAHNSYHTGEFGILRQVMDLWS